MRKIKVRKSFEKDLKRIKKSGNYSLEKLYEVVDKLAEGIILEERYRDHKLSGNYKGLRECHINPDWLLIYEIRDAELVLILNRTGSHSDLF
ncbi:type II toxin-antitoxin system YafQ family toxin [Peptoniphilus rhinitidis]|uniref:type II toxin-antitoxin system YafQ family toxin n=1 Tax=Peptoniphilus rhinitidis TaxID=1175452 RepID=UPI00290A3727|nr:type II toxin-antitoxin system YafQ family toxin [Peptoniphilus rhinitidis]MDU5594447.1 type II toxin-antitoxin system YafQ family toxin [Peptoniphilus rhinitidis]